MTLTQVFLSTSNSRSSFSSHHPQFRRHTDGEEASQPSTDSKKPWPTFSVHAAPHQTSIPLDAYIHLHERQEPYKRILKSIHPFPIDLSALRTVEELDYLPSNRNLAIRQTFAHYFSSYLPSIVTSTLGALRPQPGTFSTSPSSTSPSSSSHCSSSSSTASWNHVSDPSATHSGGSVATLSVKSSIKGRAKARSKSGLKALTGNVVILGGFRGSVLQRINASKKSERILWPNVQDAIFKKDTDPDLAMLLSADEAYGNLSWREGERRTLDLANDIKSGPMLDRVSFTDALPPLLDLGFSLRRRLERLNKIRKNDPESWVKVEQWGYDFRADLEETTDDFLKFLVELKGSARDGKGATVFAHSMGGLVVMNAIAKTNDMSLFKQVVFFGTPFQGCPGIFAPLRYGDGFFRQVNLCNPFTSSCKSSFLPSFTGVVQLTRNGLHSSLFSSAWPSSFYLLPQGQTFYTPNGKPVELDLSELKTWDHYALSPLASGVAERCEREESGISVTQRTSRVVHEGAHVQDSLGMAPAPRLGGKSQDRTQSSYPLHPSNATPDMIKAHFQRCVCRAKAFRDRLNSSHIRGNKYPPIAIVAANRLETVKGTMLSGPEPDRFVEEGYKSLVFDWGDGVVLWESAVSIPGGWGSEVVRS